MPFTCTPSRFARSYSRRVSSAATMSASASSAFNRSEASPTLPIGVAASTTVPLGTMTVRGAAFGSVASGTVRPVQCVRRGALRHDLRIILHSIHGSQYPARQVPDDHPLRP